MGFVTTLRLTAFVLLLPCALSAQAVAAPGVRDGYLVGADGARLHYLESGESNDGPTLVLIPGWTMAATIWKPQIEVFSRTHRVIAIDPRSQGESAVTADGNTPEGRARDLDALLRKLGPAQVVLVGWSQGVQDVAAFVEAFGTERLAGVVLVDAAVSAGPATVELNPQMTQGLLRQLAIYGAYPREYLGGMMDAIFAKALTPTEKERLVASSLRTPTSTGAAMLAADLLTTDRRLALGKFDRPTLVVASATSGELAELRSMVQRIAKAELVVVQDAGHAVFADQPEVFNRALAAFLGALRRS